MMELLMVQMVAFPKFTIILLIFILILIKILLR